VWIWGVGENVTAPDLEYPPTTSKYFAVKLPLPVKLSAVLLEESTTTPQPDALMMAAPLIDSAFAAVLSSA
jgi:hypothetical protein